MIMYNTQGIKVRGTTTYLLTDRISK